jgi:hypothetical protein
MFVVKWLVAASFMGLHPLLSHSAVVEQPHMRSAGLTPVVAHGACVAQGVLACKMLGWEDPLAAQLRVLRDKEAKHLAQMARIRATNMALQARSFSTGWMG